MTYNQWPYKLTVKDQPSYYRIYTWCCLNLTKGSWKPDYEKPNSFKFTHEQDLVYVTMRFV